MPGATGGNGIIAWLRKEDAVALEVVTAVAANVVAAAEEEEEEEEEEKELASALLTDHSGAIGSTLGFAGTLGLCLATDADNRIPSSSSSVNSGVSGATAASSRTNNGDESMMGALDRDTWIVVDAMAGGNRG